MNRISEQRLAEIEARYGKGYPDVTDLCAELRAARSMIGGLKLVIDSHNSAIEYRDQQLEEAKRLLKPFAADVSINPDRDDRNLLVESPHRQSRYEDCSHIALDLTMGDLRAAANFLEGKD